MAVELLHQGHELVFANGGNAIQHGVGIVITALDPFDIQYSEGSELGELDAHRHVDNAIHGAGNNRDLPGYPAQGPAAVGNRRIHRATTGNQGNFIDAVGATNSAGATELNVHLKLTYSSQPIKLPAALALMA